MAVQVRSLPGAQHIMCYMDKVAEYIKRIRASHAGTISSMIAIEHDFHQLTEEEKKQFIKQVSWQSPAECDCLENNWP